MSPIGKVGLVLADGRRVEYGPREMLAPRSMAASEVTTLVAFGEDDARASAGRLHARRAAPGRRPRQSHADPGDDRPGRRRPSCSSRPAWNARCRRPRTARCGERAARPRSRPHHRASVHQAGSAVGNRRRPRPSACPASDSAPSRGRLLRRRLTYVAHDPPGRASGSSLSGVGVSLSRRPWRSARRSHRGMSMLSSTRVSGLSGPRSSRARREWRRWVGRMVGQDVVASSATVTLEESRTRLGCVTKKAPSPARGRAAWTMRAVAARSRRMVLTPAPATRCSAQPAAAVGQPVCGVTPIDKIRLVLAERAGEVESRAAGRGSRHPLRAVGRSRSPRWWSSDEDDARQRLLGAYTLRRACRLAGVRARRGTRRR